MSGWADPMFVFLPLSEITLFVIAMFVCFRHWGNTVAEAGAYAVVVSFMLLSFCFQVAFILEAPSVSFFLEGALSLGCFIALFRCRFYFFSACRSFTTFVKTYPIGCSGLLAAFIYLGCQAILLPPDPHTWEDLSFLNLVANMGTLFPDVPPGASGAVYPMNLAILPHLFLRYHTDVGISVIGFLAYISIGCSTYALARRYSWPPTAFTVTVLVITMPRFVYLATTPDEEILRCAVSVFCLLAMNRSIEQPNIRDFILLVLAVLFCFSGNAVSSAFPLILMALACILLIRRHGTQTWKALILSHRYACLGAILPAFIFSQCVLITENMAKYGQWIGSSPDFSANNDGLQGALGNCFRYFIQSAHVTFPLDTIFNWATGLSFSTFFQHIHDQFVLPVFDRLGTASAFSVDWTPSVFVAWFGPFGFLLLIPSLVTALVRGHRRIKAIAIALCGYFYVFTLIAAWRPENVRYLSVIFACAGFSVALLLPPWRLPRTGKRVLQVAGILILTGTALFSAQKPLINYQLLTDRLHFEDRDIKGTNPILRSVFEGNIWSRSDWGMNRMVYFDPESRQVTRFRDAVPRHARVAVPSKKFRLTYPLSMAYPDVVFVPVNMDNADEQQPGGLQYVLCSRTFEGTLAAAEKRWCFSTGKNPGNDTICLFALP